MPPQAGLTADQRSANATRNAVRWINCATKTRVFNCLRQRHDLLGPIERALIDLGGLEPREVAGSIAEPPPNLGSVEKGEPKEQKTDKKEVKNRSEASGMARAVDEPGAALNSRILGKIEPRIWEAALRNAQPDVFTEGNWKMMIKRGARQLSQDRCNEFCEAMTMQDQTSPVPEHVQTEEDFVNWITDVNVACGRPLCGLVITKEAADQWPDVLYDVGDRIKRDRVTVHHKPSGKTKVIAVPSDSELYVDLGFSNLRAVLRDSRSSFNKPLSLFFADEIEMLQSKRDRALSTCASPSAKAPRPQPMDDDASAPKQPDPKKRARSSALKSEVKEEPKPKELKVEGAGKKQQSLQSMFKPHMFAKK